MKIKFRIEVVHVSDKMLAGGLKSILAPVQETSEVGSASLLHIDHWSILVHFSQSFFREVNVRTDATISEEGVWGEALTITTPQTEPKPCLTISGNLGVLP